MSDKLLPCPLCASKAVKNGYYAEIQYYGCGGSDCPMRVIAATRERWNRRFACKDWEFCCNTCDHKCGIELVKEDK